MKLLINASNIVVGGGIQVARSLIIAFLRFKDDIELNTVVSPEVATVLPNNDNGTTVSPSPAKLIRGQNSRWQLGYIEEQFRPDITLTIFGPSYWHPAALHICGFAWPWIDFDNPWPWRNLPFFRRIYQRLKVQYKLQALRRECADAYIVETDAIAKALQRILPNRPIFVIHNNFGQPFCENIGKSLPGTATVLPKKTRDEFRIVTLSQYYPHKHLEIIPQVAKILKDNDFHYDFRFYLPLDYDDQHWISLQRAAVKLGVAEHIVSVRKVSPECAPEFYDYADLMFLPTLLESFSANYPEAMIRGVPILTTDLPFSRAICRDAALFFQPMDALDAASKILAIASDQVLRKKLVSKGFKRVKEFPSPTERAEAYLEVCRKVFEGRA